MNLNEAAALARSLMDAHGLTRWRLQFDNALRRFGGCSTTAAIITLSRPLVALNTEERVRDTILHEIAHALVGARHGHDRVWRAKAREIGCSASRCYDESETVTAPMKYTATCPNCRQTHQRMRLPRGLKACAPCCRRFNRGRFDARFIFHYSPNAPGRLTLTPPPPFTTSTPAAGAAANHEEEKIMKKQNGTKKTSAADERKAREERIAQKPARRKSKAAREALEGVAALKRNADAAEGGPLDPKDVRGAEILKARGLGIELADDEFLTEPEGVKTKRIVRRNGRALAQPVYKLVPAPSPTQQSTPAKKNGKSSAPAAARAEWDKISVEGDRAQALLEKLRQGTPEKPVLAAKELNDQERHLARGLVKKGLIRRDKFEGVYGYFA